MIENETINKPTTMKNYSNNHLILIDQLKDMNKSNVSNKLDNKFLIIKRGRKFKFFYDKKKEEINLFKGKRIHNKFSNDNIRRRIKTLFHDYIIKLLNCLVKKLFIKLRMKFVKINSKITKNISIEYNRNLLDQKIKDIIIDISKKYQNKDNNIKCIRLIELQKDNKEILNILNMAYKDLYINYYLKSTKNNTKDNSYEAHKEKILSLYGKEYLDIYIKNTENFIEFFMNGKNRKSRKILEVEEINIPLKTESTETQSINEIINDDNKNIKKKMISIGFQTDISDINSKLICFS
jgi:hypothetical protein